MEGKQKCEVANCDNDAQIIVTVDGDTVIKCCRNHTAGVTYRAKVNGYKYKVEPIPPEP